MPICELCPRYTPWRICNVCTISSGSIEERFYSLLSRERTDGLSICIHGQIRKTCPQCNPHSNGNLLLYRS